MKSDSVAVVQPGVFYCVAHSIVSLNNHRTAPLVLRLREPDDSGLQQGSSTSGGTCPVPVLVEWESSVL